MEGFIEPFITEALSMSPQELETKLSRSDTFIHALARHTRDREVMRDQLTALLLAGRDTTAAYVVLGFLGAGQESSGRPKAPEGDRRAFGR